MSRIKQVQPLNEIFSPKAKQNYAICKFFTTPQNLSEFGKIETIKQSDEAIIIKIFYDNTFIFLQKILGKGLDCQILEPAELKEKFIRKIKLIGGIYEK